MRNFRISDFAFRIGDAKPQAANVAILACPLPSTIPGKNRHGLIGSGARGHMAAGDQHEVMGGIDHYAEQVDGGEDLTVGHDGGHAAWIEVAA